MDKTENFKQGVLKAAESLTYLDVMRMFNELNHTLRGEHYSFSENLQNPESETVPGFVYKGYAAGVGLRKILETLGISFTTHIKGGTGIEEQSEIHVDKKSIQKMLDLVKKCGSFQSNVFKATNINMAQNALTEPIR